MSKGQCRKVYEILDVLLYSFAILPGLRDEQNRALLIFPVPDKDTLPSYDELVSVCNYLLSVPKKSVQNRGAVVIVDASDDNRERLSDIYKLLQQLQADSPGSLAVIHLTTALRSKKDAAAYFRKIIPSLDIEVHCNTVEELLKIIPASSLPSVIGGQVPYNNDTWVKFRCNVEPFLSDCKSMGKRLEDLVRPLIDVESVIIDTCDVNVVLEKYRDLAAATMRNLKIQSLLDEGHLLIERYSAAAGDYPDMKDTLTSISDALAQLDTLQSKVDALAEKGQSRAHSMALYTKFKRNTDQLLQEVHQLTNQISDLSEEGLYDVTTVQSKQTTLDKLLLSAQTAEISAKRCITEGLSDVEDSNKIKDAEKDVKVLKKALETLTETKSKKKEKFDEILSFHQLVEECMSWFFSGLQKFTAQPVQRCNTLDGICDLERELDRHLTRCPIEGYDVLEQYSRKIATKPVISRVKMIKTKFALFEKIIIERQEYLRKLKNALLLKKPSNNDLDVEKSTFTGLTRGNPDKVLQYTQGTQFDLIDVFGCIRNSGVQTDLACVCSSDRLRNLSSRISLIEQRLNLQDRSKNIPNNANINEQLRLILRRLNIIENCLKRIRFSSLYDTFYEHPKLSRKNSSDLLLDLQNTSLQDSGFGSRPPTEQTRRPDTILTPPTLTSSSVISPGSTTPSNGGMSPVVMSPSLLLSPQSQPEFDSPEGRSRFSGFSTPTSRSSSRGQMASPLSPGLLAHSSDDLFNDRLAEIERLLIDIECQIQHDLKVDGETQTGESASDPLSDSSSQTETESETESVGTQHETESICSATQVKPDSSHVSTDTGIVHVTSSSQSDPLNQIAQHSQTPHLSVRHVPSQHVSTAVSTAMQHRSPGTEMGVQNCPVHQDSATQHTLTFSQTSSQTHRPETTSSESQFDSDSSECSAQTDMIGLFPASVQTDTQHFASQFSQTETGSSEVGVSVSPELSDQSVEADIRPSEDKETSADIKDNNHKEVEADIKSGHHKSVSAIIQMRTQSTAAAITKMFNKSSNTVNKRFKQMEVQTVRSEEDISVDTMELIEVDSIATDTENLIFLHEECSQTLLFETMFLNTPSQTDVTETLMSGSLTQSNISQETQTSDDHLIETDSAIKPAKRVYRSKEDIRKSKEDVRKSKEDLRKTRSKDDVRRTKSKDDVRKNKVEGTIRQEEVVVEDERCTCAEQEKLIMSSASISTKSIEGEESERGSERGSERESERVRATDSEEEELTDHEDVEQDWSTSSYIFPTEQLPTPISERPGQDKFVVQDSIPKKLRYVIQEMLTTEEKYVEDLKHTVEGYMDPLIQNPDPEINVLAESIFQYFGQIYSFHFQTFKDSLITAGTSQSPLKDIATTFIRHEQELEVYLSFMVHERRAHTIVEQHHEGVISELERKLDDKLGLTALIIKPTQRMVKYKQFLDIMLAGTEDFEVLEEVTDAQTLVTNILTTSNDLCHLQALDLPPDVSHEATGELLRQSDFHVSVNNKQKRVRRVFLFENLIVFSKEVTSSEDTELKYRTKHVVGLHEIGLTPYISEEPNKCHIWTPEMTLTMYSASPDDAESWSKSISNILWGQLKQIKRDRDMSRMRKTRGAVRSRGALPRNRR
ncbi:uncharacterized protein LOC134813610 isoform X2 [Bolinopsis microptera]|uniref:uncharacterized protein LOC134813610 isoform X2 n=1 Tax=Bolinopsis microptera TaxID=2820187 RepID=UPI003078EB27